MRIGSDSVLFGGGDGSVTSWCPSHESVPALVVRSRCDRLVEVRPLGPRARFVPHATAVVTMSSATRAHDAMRTTTRTREAPCDNATLTVCRRAKPRIATGFRPDDDGGGGI